MITERTKNLLETTSIHKLAIPKQYQKSLLIHSWNSMIRAELSYKDLCRKMGFNSLTDNTLIFSLSRKKVTPDEYDDVAIKYYKYYGILPNIEKLENSKNTIRNFGNKGNLYTIEGFELLKEQLQYLSTTTDKPMTGDELFEENAKRNISKVIMNFEAIIELLNKTAEKTGKVIIFQPGTLSMKRTNTVLTALAFYSNEETNNGYLAGYNGESGFTKLIRKI